MAKTHKRIDEGISRPTRYLHPRPMLRRSEEGQVEAIPPKLDPDYVLSLYLSEETTSQIAKKLGVKRKSLVAWLREKRPTEWKKAQIIRALCRKEDSEEGIEGACDALSLARARELHATARFELQALDDDYRPHQEITVVVGDLGERLRRAKEREIVAEEPQDALQQASLLPVALPQQIVDK